ncbi:hypothetical protein [Apilactobacillus micheneri]|nr:hypothetical protein [Apilactobacillus micheneri]
MKKLLLYTLGFTLFAIATLAVYKNVDVATIKNAANHIPSLNK